MAEHPVVKHIENLAKHHRHTREHHTARAVQLAANRDAVDAQRREALAGKVEATGEPGSDHGPS